jgi:outer membrane protein assembly factor BamA
VGRNQITPNSAQGHLLELLSPLGAGGGFLFLANTSLRRDTRDDYNDSSRGTFEELLLEYGLGGGGDFRGGRLGFEHRHFLPLPPGLVLACRAGGALAFGDLPFYEELKLGGDETVRGLAAARERGEGRLLFNAELRWPGFSPLPSLPVRGGLLVFFDAGQIFRRARGPSLGKWRTGAGLGLRCHWHSTIVRADLGRSGRRTGIYLNFSQVF